MNSISEEQQDKLLDQVNMIYKSATTPYLQSLMQKSNAIREQFEPSYLEALGGGRDEPFEEGKKQKGIQGVERIYKDRIVLTPHFNCASYCRYCFKKKRTLQGIGTHMTDSDIESAIDLIKSDNDLTTALITGGDPMASPRRLFKLLNKLVDIPHVTKIRVGTRHILFNPSKVTDSLVSQISEYNYTDPFNLANSKSVSLGVSLNHADELAPEVVQAIQKFVRKGVQVRGQTVLLKNINDTPQSLLSLIDKMMLSGVSPYYLFHNMDVSGNSHMRTSVKKGLDILQDLAEYSGTYNMTYVYVTPVGKHRISPGSNLDYVTVDGKRYIKAISPYKAKDFLCYSGKNELPDMHYEDNNGYIVSHYLDSED
ncbi:4Fe-4S cluster-binding domain-containing protein [Candidatus Sororendozoicomonas aggregata]|uniref:4Fe-4S cluster-binding domain-containing protein n=1 Tax=Candidatus Sororendozoicomonas aggregata TaxID=3073239 RepID=UPI002ED2F1DC